MRKGFHKHDSKWFYLSRDTKYAGFTEEDLDFIKRHAANDIYIWAVDLWATANDIQYRVGMLSQKEAEGVDQFRSPFSFPVHSNKYDTLVTEIVIIECARVGLAAVRVRFRARKKKERSFRGEDGRNGATNAARGRGVRRVSTPIGGV